MEEVTGQVKCIKGKCSLRELFVFVEEAGVIGLSSTFYTVISSVLEEKVWFAAHGCST